MSPPLQMPMADVTDVEPKLKVLADEAPADTDLWCTYAQIEVAGLRMAIAAEHVREAVPRPEHVTRLPRSQGALEGVFKLRGQVVPIVDLRLWMNRPTDTRQPHVMVLGADNRVVGVATDAIHGLLRLRASQVHAVHREESDDSFFHSVLSVSDDAELISVLDPVRLMERARAWADERTQESPTADSRQPGVPSHQAVASTPTQALFRLGPAVLSLPAANVREALPRPPLQRVFGRGTPMLGMVRWRGVDVPLIDPASVLALPLDTDVTGQRLVVVLESEGRHVAIPVNGVLAVRSFASTQVQAAADTALPQATFFLGSTVLESGQRVLLLDSARVLRDYGLTPTTVSSDLPQARHGAGQRLLGNASPVEDDRACVQDAAQAHVVFDMGSEWAAPMSLLQEITPFPSNFKPGVGSDPAVVGTVEWRGKTLPVLDLRTPAQPADFHRGLRLMVIQTNDRLAALVVNDVVALLAAHQGVHTRVRMANGEHMHLITVGQPPNRKSHRVLDVSAVPFFGTPASYPPP